MNVPGKVYGRILTERLMEVTEGKVSEEQGDFRKGRGCIDQIFAMKRLVEEYLGKIKSCTQLLWFLRRHTIGLTEKLSGVCCISMVWVERYKKEYRPFIERQMHVWGWEARKLTYLPEPP